VSGWREVRLTALAIVLALIAAGLPPGAAAAPRHSRAPSQLVERFPLKPRTRAVMLPAVQVPRGALAPLPSNPTGGSPAWLYLLAACGCLMMGVAVVRELRTSPSRALARRRHDVAPAVLVALRPLFRYSAQRDAWILRGVGARRGPVLTPRRRRKTS
jgi:hypothetical protein